MHVLGLCAAAIGGLFLIEPVTATVAVYDNLGPTNGVMVGGGSIGIVASEEYQHGLRFIPTRTVRLTTFELMLSRVVSSPGVGPALVELRLDAGDLPGPVVESWTTAPISALTSSVYPFASTLGSTLAQGQKYWITVGRAPNSSFGGAWHFTTNEAENAWEAYRSPGTPWSTMYRRGYGTRVAGAPVLPGDANEDGLVNLDDYTLLDRGLAMHLAGWRNGDFNGDGAVTPADYLVIDAAFLQQQAGAPSPDFLSLRESQFGEAYVSSLIAAVPEPTFALTGLLAAHPLITRRRRRR